MTQATTEEPDPEPIYCWQTLDSVDGRWALIAAVVGGQLLVLATRDKEAATGMMRSLAERHSREVDDPVRLHRFVHDPSFEETVYD